MKDIVDLHHRHDEDKIMAYHKTEDYTTFIEQNDSRLEAIAALTRELWEPFRKAFANKVDNESLQVCRILRNRFAHSLLEAPDSSRIFLAELKRANWTGDDWALFVVDSLREMNGLIQINERLLFRDGQDILSAAAQAKQKLAHHRSDLKSITDYLTAKDEWTHYVDVRDERGNIAIDRLTKLLDPNKPRTVVQICGEGGLGKTALMREFIRRNVMNGPEENLYDNYLILSSKSPAQGEVKTTPGGVNTFETLDPKYPQKGPLRFTEGLGFLEFLRIIAAYSGTDSTDPEAIRIAIEQNKFLIVLDNFEDCSDLDRKQYLDLFESLETGCLSRIIITGRMEASADDIPTIRLGYLSSDAASKLLVARYLYLQQNHSSPGIWEFRNTIYNALDELRQVDFIQALNTSVSDGAVSVSEQLNPAVFRDRIGHPLVILRMAVEMGRPDLPTTYENESDSSLRLISILIQIATSNGFRTWEQEVSKWVTDKAYDDISTYPECVIILYRLLKGTASLADLKSHVEEQGGQVEQVAEAIRRLESHQILIRRRNSDNRYEAMEQAKSHIQIPTENDEGGRSSTTKVADEIESILDDILRGVIDSKTDDEDTSIRKLLAQEIPLHKRQSLTKQSYTIIEVILLNFRGKLSEPRIELAKAFAELGAQLLQNEVQEDLRTLGTIILLRSLYTISADVHTFHTYTRNLNAADIARTNQQTRMIVLTYLLKVIQESRDLYPLYLADILSILASCGAHSAMLYSDLDGAWSRIKTHPNVKHGNLLEGTEADVRLLLRRMAKNDRSWDEVSANILNEYQAEDERQHWNDILTWQRYSIPPNAPGDDVLENIVLPEKFDPGTNGLSFDSIQDGKAVFHLVESPVLSLIGSTQETSEEPPWSTKKQEEFVETVTAWFKEKIAARPSGFPATDLTNFIVQTFGMRTKEIIPRATDNKYQAWMPWFEDTILNQSQFNTYVLVRPNGKHVTISRKNLTENPRHWLFDDTSATAPRLPQASDVAEIIVNISSGNDLPVHLSLNHLGFLVPYRAWLDSKMMKERDLSITEHIDCIQEFVRNCMKESELTEENQQRVESQMESWRVLVFSRIRHMNSGYNQTLKPEQKRYYDELQRKKSKEDQIEKEKARRKRGNQALKPIRGRKKVIEEE